MTAELRLHRALGAPADRVWLAPTSGGTNLALRHEGFSGERARDDHIQGWRDCLDRLPGWLAPPA